MRILQVLLPVGLGGVERIAAMLHEYGNCNGDTMGMAIGKSYASHLLNKFNVRNTDSIFLIDDTSMINALKTLRKIVKEFRPDIIHTHARRECFLSCLINFNGINTRTQHMAENPHIRVTWGEKLLLKHSVSLWIATSRQLKKNYIDKLGYIDEKKVRVIYNGINLSAAKTHEDRIYKFCIISRLSYQKGIDILLEQIHQMPDELKERIKIDLWGEGPEKTKLLNMIHDNKLENNVCYRGVTYKPEEQLYHYDALLMPSRYEGLPLTMLESMACKAPVAIHNVGCVSEFMHNHVNGWIIDDHFTWKDFFSQLTDIQYPWEKVSEQSYRTYCEAFKGEGMCKRYFELFNSLL